MGSNVDFLVENWLLLAAALTSGGLLLWPMLQKGAQGSGISPGEAVRLINRERAVVIDVSDTAEFAAGHVVCARSVPLGALDSSKDLPGNKTLPLVLVCTSGVRARKAAASLAKRGYQNTQVLAGGMQAWREAGLPVEVSA
jgi:rhodanese-related sulfurtransferase